MWLGYALFPLPHSIVILLSCAVAAQLQPVNDFVAISKLQRQIIEVNKAVAACEAAVVPWLQPVVVRGVSVRAPRTAAVGLCEKTAGNVFLVLVLLPQTALTLLCMGVFWSSEGVPLPSGWAVPFPTSRTEDEVMPRATLAVVAWAAICQVVAWRVCYPLVTSVLQSMATPP